MSRRCHFRVVGRFELASRPQEATVTIDRDAGTISVRVLRRRNAWTVSLAGAAELVVRQMIRAELAAQRAEKLHRRRAAASRRRS